MQIHGILVPNITPFTHRGEIDEDALRNCVKYLIASGVTGLAPCGSNGEAPYLSRQEREKVIEIVVDEADGKVLVIAGTGSISTRETILLTEDAKGLGVDAALVVTPFYFRISNNEIFKHYRVLLETVDLPIIIYNVPKFTNFNLKPSIISRLASEYENLVGVKDSSGNINQITEIIRLVGKRISVLAGTADVILPSLMLGGNAAVIAVANVFPEICVDLYQAFRKGDFKKAGQLQKDISYLTHILVTKYNQISAIKAAMNYKGLPGGFPRRPSLPLEQKAQKEIEYILENIRIPEKF